MKKFFFLFYIFLSFQFSIACDKSSASVVSATNNGNGTFTYVFNVCREYHGIEGNPDLLRFSFNCSAAPIPVGQRVTVSTFSPASYSTTGGDVYTGAKSGAVLTYSNSSFSIVHAANVFCSNFTITVSGYPTSVAIMTNDYPSAGCVIALPLAPLALLEPPVSNGKTICVNTSTTLSATGCAGGQLKWYSAASGGTSLQTGATYSPPTFTASKSYFVDCSVSTGGCATVRTEVPVVTVTPPAPPTTTSDDICEGETALLGANGSNTLDWYSNTSGGTAFQTGNAYTTPTLSSSITYYVENSIGDCHSASRTPVNANVSPLPASPSPSASPSNICMNASSALSAIGCASGTLEWYGAASGGGVLQTGNSFSTPALTANSTYYVSCTENNCTSARSGISITMLPCTLAVDLVYFKSKCINNQVELLWETPNKLENMFFEVEKSNDGVHFYPQNNYQNIENQGNKYSYIDNSQLNGGDYYRVVLIDPNGTRQESATIRADVDCQMQGISIISSTYQANQANITVAASEENQTTLSIWDISGKVLYNEPINLQKGLNYVEIPIALPTSIYLVRINSSGKADVKKMGVR